ncbi:MAG: hypothetical protein H0W72_15870 [Planctomycetes bacterium]|nr:hypothetical protein [Planctomycetota bacterium]
MARPLLDLDQDWHRQRAQLRTGNRRPPPLVTAGLDVVHGDQGHPQVKVAGMALIFGLFPPTLEEFIELARTRLRLGQESSRNELQGVLGARIQALWAWLPTLQQDAYLEFDHATDLHRLWLLGPGSGQMREVDSELESAGLDAAFLGALVITGARNWGGREGLSRLVERFGRQPMLVAAQVADALEREARSPETALTLAQTRWPALNPYDEPAWEPLVDSEPPWTCVQLGRLALRLGLFRASRLLLGQAKKVDCTPIAWFDLGQACEALDDLTHGESAFAHYTTLQADDADGWRRLLFCRLRLGLLWEAEETLKRYRTAGGPEREVVDRLIQTLRRPRLPLIQRAHLAGWLGARATSALAARLPVGLIVEEALAQREADGSESDGPKLRELVERLRAEIQRLLSQPGQATSPDQLPGSGLIESLIRVCLLTLPLLAVQPPTQLASQAGAHTLLAVKIWGDLTLGVDHAPDSLELRGCLLDLARFALT